MKKTAVLLLIVVAALCSQVYAAVSWMPDDIETYMQIGYATSPVISPDGKTIYFTTGFTDDKQIFRITEGNRYPYQLTFRKEGVYDYYLSPNGKWMIFRCDSGGDEQFQLWLMDPVTGRCKPLTTNPKVRYGSPVWSNNSDKIYYSANINNPRYFDLYEMDINTGKEKLILDKQGYYAATALSPDGKKLLCTQHLSNVDYNLYLLDLTTGEAKLLTKHEGAYIYIGVGFSKDGKQIYLISNKNQNELKKTAVLDIATGKMVFTLDSKSPWEVDEIDLSPDRSVMTLIINENGYARLKLFETATGKELPSPKFEGIAGAPSMSKTTKMAFALNTPVTTMDVYTWDWKTKQLRQLTFSSYAGIDPKTFIAPKLIKYKSFDGLEIPAFVYLPKNWEKNKGNIPFIIEFHGGPESQFRPYFQRNYNYLLNKGFGIMSPNIRGSAGYGKKYLDLDNYKSRMDSVKDGYYAAKYLVDMGYSRPKKIGIRGGSYGGFMVMALLTEYPEMWGAGLESVGIVDFLNFLKTTSSYRQALREPEYGPLSDEEFLKSISPINKIEKVQAPLMVVHGKNDPRVPVTEAYAIIDNLKKRGVAVEALIFPDEGHGVRKKENRLTEYRKMAEFFEKHLMDK
ncbi:MAG: S9 family peptidase [Firmicutes bacterium]|nr:S9 family peptidase [Bacillota bacterium]